MAAPHGLGSARSLRHSSADCGTSYVSSVQGVGGLRPVRVSHGATRSALLSGRPTAAVNLADMAAASKLVKPKQGLSSRIPRRNQSLTAIASPFDALSGENQAKLTTDVQDEVVSSAFTTDATMLRPYRLKSNAFQFKRGTPEPCASANGRLSRQSRIDGLHPTAIPPTRPQPSPLYALLQGIKVKEAPMAITLPLCTSASFSESDSEEESGQIGGFGAGHGASYLPAAPEPTPKPSLQQFILYSQKEHQRLLLEASASEQPKKQRGLPSRKARIAESGSLGLEAATSSTNARRESAPKYERTSVSDALEGSDVPLNTVKISLSAITAMEGGRQQQARLREEQELKQVMSTVDAD